MFNVTASVSDVRITQFKGTPGGDNWGEGTLDATYITSMAPGVTTWVVNSNTSMSTEEGTGFGWAFYDELMALNQVQLLPVTVLSLSLGSMSWDTCDSLCSMVASQGVYTKQECDDYMQTQRQVCMYDSKIQIDRMNFEMMKLGLRGVSILAASGDGGSHFSFEKFPSGGIGDPLNQLSCQFNWPTYPASSPYATGVGGTDFGTDQDQVAWPSSGGGFSLESAMPLYQQAAVQAYLTQNNNTPDFPSPGSFVATNRAYPDIAALSNHVPLIIDGSLYGSSGTSASTPEFAAIFSLINDQRLNKGLSPLGFLNPRLYNLAEQHPGEAFYDITSGNSKTTCTQGFPASVGWDPLTGLGSPIWPGLVKYLVAN